MGSVAPLDLRREDVPGLWRAGAGEIPVLPGVRGAGPGASFSVGERRKLVTVIFADVVGSTALGERVDPETLRWAMQRWFGRMREVIERHGGTVEKFIGDAVMAVFGMPVAHEDDALRAVRAAAEMREEGAVLRDELRRERGLDFSVRIGVNTGQAVTGATARGLLHVRRYGQRRGAPGAGGARRRDPAGARDVPARAPCRRRRGDGAAGAQGQVRAGRGLPPARRRLRCARAGAARPGRRWSAVSGSAGGCSTPSIRRSPIARASCSPCSALRAWASRGSCERCWRRSTAQPPWPRAAACPTATA